MSRVAKNVEGSKKCRGEQNLMFFDKCNFKICRPTQKGGGGGGRRTLNVIAIRNVIARDSY